MLDRPPKLSRVALPAPETASAARRRVPRVEILRARLGNAGLSHLLRTLQRSATVSMPGDPMEREADQVADQVMRMADPEVQRQAPPSIQRMCAGCEEEQSVARQMEGDEEDEELALARRADGAEEAERLDTDGAVRAAEQGGQPLPDSARQFFEPRFGQDFSQVRVHSDGEAAQAAHGVQARAYTIGRDIVFGAGEYAPGTARGDRLLAHELTHVVQQGGSSPQPDAGSGQPGEHEQP